MSEWREYKISELCTDIIDCVNKTAPISSVPTPYHMLRTSDIRNGFVNLVGLNCVSEEVFNKWTRRGKLQEGDIIFTREAPLGEAAMVREAENYFLGQRLVLYRANPRVCDNRFLLYWFLNPINKAGLKSKGVGSTVTHMRVPECEQVRVSAPPLAMQKRIGNNLAAYDDLIETNQRQIKLLEEAAQRLYKEWFVDLRYPGHENVPVVDGVPEGWKQGTIQDIVEYHDTKRKPLSGQQREKMKGKYRYYGAAGILDYVNSYLFDGIFLLLGEDGTVITEEGFPVLQYVSGQFWVNNHAHVLTGRGDYSTEFLYMKFSRMGISDVVTGVAQPKISQGRLSDKKTLIPNPSIVKMFDYRTKSIFEKILQLQKQIDYLSEARDRLLPKLMSGEIAV